MKEISASPQKTTLHCLQFLNLSQSFGWLIFFRKESNLKKISCFHEKKKLLFMLEFLQEGTNVIFTLGNVTKYFLSVELEEQGLECGLYRHWAVLCLNLIPSTTSRFWVLGCHQNVLFYPPPFWSESYQLLNEFSNEIQRNFLSALSNDQAGTTITDDCIAKIPPGEAWTFTMNDLFGDGKQKTKHFSFGVPSYLLIDIPTCKPEISARFENKLKISSERELYINVKLHIIFLFRRACFFDSFRHWKILQLFRRLRRHYNRVKNFPKWTQNFDIRSNPIRSDPQIVPPIPRAWILNFLVKIEAIYVGKVKGIIWKFAHREKEFKRPEILKIQQNWWKSEFQNSTFSRKSNNFQKNWKNTANFVKIIQQFLKNVEFWNSFSSTLFLKNVEIQQFLKTWMKTSW